MALPVRVVCLNMYGLWGAGVVAGDSYYRSFKSLVNSLADVLELYYSAKRQRHLRGLGTHLAMHCGRVVFVASNNQYISASVRQSGSEFLFSHRCSSVNCPKPFPAFYALTILPSLGYEPLPGCGPLGCGVCGSNCSGRRKLPGRSGGSPNAFCKRKAGGEWILLSRPLRQLIKLVRHPGRGPQSWLAVGEPPQPPMKLSLACGGSRAKMAFAGRCGLSICEG